MTGAFDFARLGEIVRVAVPFLDRVIDRNYYPTPRTAASNARWRPVGLGVMGLQDVFFQLGLAFDSDEARQLSRRIAEEIYFHALWASTELAELSGPHETFPETHAAQGRLQFDLWGLSPSDPERWQPLRDRIARFGLRNSLLVAIAPTATIASIAGCYECIEPQVSNLFKRETLSGEFLQVNTYLVRELQRLGPLGRSDAVKDQGGRRVGPGHRTDPARHKRRLPHGLGDTHAFADRHGCRTRRVHRPEPVAQPVRGRPDHRQALVDVPPRLEARAQDHVLPAVPPGDPHRGRHCPGGRCARRAHVRRARRPTPTAVACSLENPETCEVCD